jgi:hypothetical protein
MIINYRDIKFEDWPNKNGIHQLEILRLFLLGSFQMMKKERMHQESNQNDP